MCVCVYVCLCVSLRGADGWRQTAKTKRRKENKEEKDGGVSTVKTRPTNGTKTAWLMCKTSLVVCVCVFVCLHAQISLQRYSGSGLSGNQCENTAVGL